MNQYALSSDDQPSGPLVQRIDKTSRELAELGATQRMKPERLADVGFMSILKMVMKWRLLVLSVTVFSLLLALVITLLMPPTYTAKATIEVKPEAMKVIDAETVDPAAPSASSFMSTQLGLLTSHSLAAKVVQTVNRARPPGVEPIRLSDAIRHMSALPRRDSQLIDIQFESNNPVRAAQIANAYSDAFIDDSIERRFDTSAFARQFLEKRLASTKIKLEKSEADVVKYAANNNIINVQSSVSDGGNKGGGETSLTSTSLIALNAALADAQNERIVAEQRFREAASSEARSSVTGNPVVQQLEQQRAQLQADYQDKLNLLKPDYPTMLELKRHIDSLSRSIAAASSTVSSSKTAEIGAAYRATVGHERELQERVKMLKNEMLALRDRSIQYNFLQREVDTNRALYDGLLQRYKEIGANVGSGDRNISVVDRAEVPTALSSPSIRLNLAIGAFIGLILGVGIAIAIEALHDTFDSPEMVREKLSVAVLGVITKLKDTDFLASLMDRRSEIAEAYLSVLTSLQFVSSQGVPKSILVTSTRTGEGKSSSSLAIAYSLASIGKRVLLIDADMRSPTFISAGDSKDGAAPGLSNVLSGLANYQQAIHPTSIPDMWLMRAGPMTPNPAELLGLPDTALKLKEIFSFFDVTIVDSPPVLGLADAPTLSSICQATVMVIEASSTKRRSAAAALDRLNAVGANIVGAILTKYNSKRDLYGYGYGGDWDYGYNNNPGYISNRILIEDGD